jgi:hypothetical protein
MTRPDLRIVAPVDYDTRPTRKIWIEPEVTWGEITFVVLAVLAMWTFVFALDAGWL